MLFLPYSPYYVAGSVSDPRAWQAHDIVRDRSGRRALVTHPMDANGRVSLIVIHAGHHEDGRDLYMSTIALVDGYGFERIGELTLPSFWCAAASSLIEDTLDERIDLVRGA